MRVSNILKISTVEIPKITNLSTVKIGNLSLSTAWFRGQTGFAGFGVKTKIDLSGNNRFTDVRKWWQDQLNTFQIENQLTDFGTGPLLFSSFAFVPSSKSTFLIPEVIVGQNEKRAWITWFGDIKRPELQIENKTSPAVANQFKWATGAMSENEWQKQISTALEKIDNGEIEKVVIARDLIAAAETEIDIQKLIANLEKEYPNTWVFLNDGLVGATPELLIRLKKNLVTSRILAGTIQKTGDENKDLALAASLAKSSKDLEEHEYAVKSVADALDGFCSSINSPETPFVLHLSNVMHLATDVTGVIKNNLNQIDILKLVEKLHPSAAVCGTPTEKANSVIAELEKMDRQRYAGPVGWIDSTFEGEFGIALRCGQISDDLKSIRLFAGCGIVAMSDPAKELLESQAKFMPMRTALQTL